MKLPSSFARVHRLAHKPPSYIAERLLAEMQRRTDRWRAPLRAARLSIDAILRETGDRSVAALWQRLTSRPYVAPVPRGRMAAYEQVCPGDAARIFTQAEKALRHEIDLLGSGPKHLGERIDWSADFKTNICWPNQYWAAIDYNNPGRPSDVKNPWELSRLQWLIPAGQAYALSADEKYAHAARNILEQWIEANPYAYSVNWACTLEVALRIISWTWLFHVFARSEAWQDGPFQTKFLRTLYLHGEFTARNLEKSDVNGNHYTGDAAGLVFAGLFFGAGPRAAEWLRTGWETLCSEIELQVFPDGVDYEASVPYHRFVQELFLLPALYRWRNQLPVPESYRQRLISMAQFTAAYSRTDGSSPLWGDADDARALPLGGQAIGDHRYLIGIQAALWKPEMLQLASGPVEEAYWLLGPEQARRIPRSSSAPLNSQSFREGGFYVMRNMGGDHVFIDCGPLGLAGRGGHGHNDLLSFEAALCGVPLVSDCGAYVYTASHQERNNFRSTGYHNTPQVGGEEINRFVHPDLLWILHNDAKPEVRRWQCSEQEDMFVGSHSGYQRLPQPTTPVRTIRLRHEEHRLDILDEFEGATEASIQVPLHLAPGVRILEIASGRVDLEAQQRGFRLCWDSATEWQCTVAPARVSPSYGRVIATLRLTWRRTDPKSQRLSVSIFPVDRRPEKVRSQNG